MNPLSLREKAAGVLFVRLGSNMPPPVEAEADAERVRALLRRCPVGGLLLFNGRWPALPGVLTRLQAASPRPLLVATDMERGVGQQVAGATTFPHAMAFGAAGEEAEGQVKAAARAAAREAQACGIHVTLAPVADVNLNPQNPIIATRALGAEPAQVARLAAAYVRGCRAEGLLSVAKHFPGHGRVAADPHAELPVVEAKAEALKAVDLAPFRAALEAGAEGVMTAHVAYPALDPGASRPATLSPPILQGLLREQMGFTGAVFSDSLLMGAMRDTHATPGAQAAALLRAGVDVLLDPQEPEAVTDGLVQAVREGQLPEARLDEAFGRVQALRQAVQRRFGAAAFTGGYGPLAGGAVGGREQEALAAQVAARAVTVLRQRPGALPLSKDGEPCFAYVTPRRRPAGTPEAPLGAAARAAFPGAQYCEVDADTEAAAWAQLREAAGRARHVVVALVVQPAAWRLFGLTPPQRAFVQALTEAQPVVVASLGSPHVLEAFPEAAAQLCTYTDAAPAQRALAGALAGEGPLLGKASARGPLQ